MESKNKELLTYKINELVVLLKSTNDYKRYLFLKEEMQKNKELMSIINDIKSKEKERINKKYCKEKVDILEGKIKELNKELESYPSYQEYIYLQEDINNTLQNVRQIIENSINNL